MVHYATTGTRTAALKRGARNDRATPRDDQRRSYADGCRRCCPSSMVSARRCTMASICSFDSLSPAAMTRSRNRAMSDSRRRCVEVTASSNRSHSAPTAHLSVRRAAARTRGRRWLEVLQLHGSHTRRQLQHVFVRHVRADWPQPVRDVERESTDAIGHVGAVERAIHHARRAEWQEWCVISCVLPDAAGARRSHADACQSARSPVSAAK